MHNVANCIKLSLVISTEILCGKQTLKHCFVLCLYRSCQSMTSLFSNTMSPAKDGNSSLPRRSSNLSKPPLRALYDLLIAPMEGVSTCLGHCLPIDVAV